MNLLPRVPIACFLLRCVLEPWYNTVQCERLHPPSRLMHELVLQGGGEKHQRERLRPPPPPKQHIDQIKVRKERGRKF